MAAAIAVFSPELDHFVTSIVPFGHGLPGAESCETPHETEINHRFLSVEPIIIDLDHVQS